MQLIDSLLRSKVPQLGKRYPFILFLIPKYIGEFEFLVGRDEAVRCA